MGIESRGPPSHGPQKARETGRRPAADQPQTEPRHTRGMKKALPLVLGGLMVVVGLVWTLQGLGYVSGSPMTGVAFWAIVGPIVAGFGVALMIVGVGKRS